MKSLVLLVIGALCLGCGGGRRGERRQEVRDDRRDRRVEAMTGWNKLGERWVDGAADHDTILVTAAEGRFRQIQIVVEHSALEMWGLKVTFGNGTTFEPDTRLVFGKDSASRVIDLPGEARFIRQVEFMYGNLPGGGKAQIELWAK